MKPASFLVFGTASWDAPWLTEQNLARALSRRGRVLYVQPPITPLTPLRYGVRPETREQARRLAQRRPRKADEVDIFQPLVLPPRSNDVSRRISAPLLRRQVAAAAARVGLHDPVVITGHATPGTFDSVPASCRVYLVKDWIQAGADLLGRPAATLARERDAMCEAADVICAITPQLQRTLADHGFQSKLLRHGFQADQAERYERAARPREYDGLSTPLIGYAGRIDGRLDFDLLAATADRFPGATLVMIGPISPRLPAEQLTRVTSRPNTHFLGPVDRDVLPGYLAHLDCALLPYSDGEWTHHGSPLKLWDYLYAGPPIVGSGCTVLREFGPPLVRFASETEGFLGELEAALEAPREGRDQRRAVALENSWDARAAELEAIAAAASD